MGNGTQIRQMLQINTDEIRENPLNQSHQCSICVITQLVT